MAGYTDSWAEELYLKCWPESFLVTNPRFLWLNEQSLHKLTQELSSILGLALGTEIEQV